MIKKWTFSLLILILVQMACNLPQAAPRAEQTPLSLASATIESFPAVSQPNTPLPEVALVATDTPVPETLTPTDTLTPTATFTETPTPTSTLTLTPDPKQLFSAIKQDVTAISAGCEPKLVRLDVTSSDPNVYSVVLFVRLVGKTKGEKSAWNDGFAMTPLGSGSFFINLKASSLPDYKKFMQAWVQYQLVATDKSSAIIGRSEVFPDSLSFSLACP